MFGDSCSALLDVVEEDAVPQSMASVTFNFEVIEFKTLEKVKRHFRKTGEKPSSEETLEWALKFYEKDIGTNTSIKSGVFSALWNARWQDALHRNKMSEWFV